MRDVYCEKQIQNYSLNTFRTLMPSLYIEKLRKILAYMEEISWFGTLILDYEYWRASGGLKKNQYKKLCYR